MATLRDHILTGEACIYPTPDYGEELPMPRQTEDTVRTFLDSCADASLRLMGTLDDGDLVWFSTTTTPKPIGSHTHQVQLRGVVGSLGGEAEYAAELAIIFPYLPRLTTAIRNIKNQDAFNRVPSVRLLLSSPMPRADEVIYGPRTKKPYMIM